MDRRCPTERHTAAKVHSYYFRKLHAGQLHSHHSHVLSIGDRHWTLTAIYLDPHPASRPVNCRPFGYAKFIFCQLLLTNNKTAFTKRSHVHTPSSDISTRIEQKGRGDSGTAHEACEQRAEYATNLELINIDRYTFSYCACLFGRLEWAIKKQLRLMQRVTLSLACDVWFSRLKPVFDRCRLEDTKPRPDTAGVINTEAG